MLGVFDIWVKPSQPHHDQLYRGASGVSVRWRRAAAVKREPLTSSRTVEGCQALSCFRGESSPNLRCRSGSLDVGLGRCFSPNNSFPCSIGLSSVAPNRSLGQLDWERPPRSGRGRDGMLASPPAVGEPRKLQKRERERRRWQHHPGKHPLGAEERSLLVKAARG